MGQKFQHNQQMATQRIRRRSVMHGGTGTGKANNGINVTQMDEETEMRLLRESNTEKNKNEK